MSEYNDTPDGAVVERVKQVRGGLDATLSSGGKPMKIKDVMTRDVVCVSPDASIAEAAAQMKALDEGPLPVCDGERLVGMVAGDVATRASVAGQDPQSTRVRDLMTPEVLFCFEGQDVAEAARLMQQKKVRRLVVLNRGSRLVGLVSLDDLAVDGARRGIASG